MTIKAVIRKLILSQLIEIWCGGNTYEAKKLKRLLGLWGV